MRDGNTMQALIELIADTIKREVVASGTVTRYGEPLVGFVAADAPDFAQLRRTIDPTHMLPQDLLPGARSVVSFFVPFAPDVVRANAQHRDEVAREWAVAYVETNALIGRIAAVLTGTLAQRGIRTAAEPATHNFDTVKLVSYFHDASCVECVMRCPVGALDEANAIDKQRCWARCLETAAEFKDLGQADVCGKCSYGPCALESAV